MANISTFKQNPIFFIVSNFLKLYIFLGLLLRITLMITAPSDASFCFFEILRSIVLGLLSDIGTGLLLLIPLFMLYPMLNEAKYNKIAGVCIEALLIICFAYSFWHKNIFYEYGGVVPNIAQILLGWKVFSFSIRFFIPKIRLLWRSCSLYFSWILYVGLLFFISIGEYLFWEEFGVRYNFIAVDYLIYTNEVIGNIMESYSIIPVIITVIVCSLGIIWLQSRKAHFKLERIYNVKTLCFHIIYFILSVLVGWGILTAIDPITAKNHYVDQIGRNGIDCFVRAFFNNTLEYNKFYTMLPEKEVKRNYYKLADLNANGEKELSTKGVSQLKNIVLITVESLSADFLTRYGNKQSITPNLDVLMTKSLVLDSLFANGNRTVRGLEALSLCIPPVSGESIIKQKNNRMGDLSVGAQLKKLGYTVQFLYGGDSYFDNMGNFFSNNGYEIIDRKNIDPAKITFANIWGVCDEDMFNKSLEVFDKDAAKGKPFFAHIMTTSNHRPYTYPKGKIKYDGNIHCREAAVKYTDYAIGKFISDATHKSWFKNTVFIIIADHCASSAGSTSLPIDKYHIPCLIYSPNFIRPKVISTLCSQIDVMPTVMAMLRLHVKVRFTGQDIFSPLYKPRAFMATYQDLGYLENNKLTVLSPVKKTLQYAVKYKKGEEAKEYLLSQQDLPLLKKAQSYYQYINLYLKRK